MSLLWLTAPLLLVPQEGRQEEPAPPSWMPDLSVHGSFIGRFDDTIALDQDGREIDDRMRLRRLDLDLVEELDAGVLARVSLSLQADPVSDFDTELEAGYVELDERAFRGPRARPAGGLRYAVRFGRFRSRFGYVNQLRAFELPQLTRPESHSRLFGERGLVQTGIAGELSVGDERSRWRFLVEGLDNGDLPISDTSGDEAFASVWKAAWSGALGDATRAEVGTSLYRGKRDGDLGLRNHVVGLDAVVEHEDTGGRGFLVGAELFQAFLDRPGGATDATPTSGYAFAQLRPGGPWSWGARFDYAEDAADEDLASRLYSLFASVRVRPGVRLSFGFEHTQSDAVQRDGANTLFFEAAFTFGAHPLSLR